MVGSQKPQAGKPTRSKRTPRDRSEGKRNVVSTHNFDVDRATVWAVARAARDAGKRYMPAEDFVEGVQQVIYRGSGIDPKLDIYEVWADTRSQSGCSIVVTGISSPPYNPQKSPSLTKGPIVDVSDGIARFVARQRIVTGVELLTGQKSAPETDVTKSAQTESNQDFLARALKRDGESSRASAIGDDLPVLEAADLLGGAATLGVTVRTPADMARLVQSGLPAGVIEKLRSAGFKQTELTVLVAPSRTLNRRKTDGRFTVEESSKIEHLARILALSDRTFGDRRLALDWLRRPQARLSGQSPMDYLASDIGGRVVEEILIQSEYGIFG